MSNKIKFLSISVAIFIFSFLFLEQAHAATCWTGTCKAACSATEEVSTAVGDGCGSAEEVCCVPKSCTGSVGCVTTSSCETIVSGSCGSGQSCCDKFKSATTQTPTSCADLFPGAPCFDSKGKSGTCNSGACSVPTTSDGKPISGSGSGWNSDDLDQFGLPDAGGTGDVGYVIMGVLNWLLAIVGIVAIIALVISGFQYFMVATDEKMLESAKKTMQAAIIGLIVALSGFIAIQAIDTMLNAGYLF